MRITDIVKKKVFGVKDNRKLDSWKRPVRCDVIFADIVPATAADLSGNTLS
jgi:hypothetical protein